MTFPFWAILAMTVMLVVQSGILTFMVFRIATLESDLRATWTRMETVAPLGAKAKIPTRDLRSSS